MAKVHIFIHWYISYIFQCITTIYKDIKTNKKQAKNPQKQETQQSDTNMIKHDKKGLDKLIAAKQTFYQ